jgi:hypothetical protein
MKHLLLTLIALFAIVIGFSQNYQLNGRNTDYIGYNKFSATKLKVGNTALTEAKLQNYDSALADSLSPEGILVMVADSGDSYVTPGGMADYVAANSSGSGIGFAAYDSLAIDSSYFNTRLHQLRVRYGGKWYGFESADSAIIYVAPTGVPTNLLLYSEIISNASWTKSNITSVTDDQENDLESNQTLDLITTTSSDASIYQTFTVQPSTHYYFSFDCKRGADLTWFGYTIANITNPSYIAEAVNYYSLTSTSVQRVTIEFDTPAGCTSVRVYLLDGCSGAGTIYHGRIQVSPNNDGYIETTSTTQP